MSTSDAISSPHQPATRRLVLVAGQEGAGKTTVIRALLPHTPDGARVDGEDLGQVNPCHYDEAFWHLLRVNVAALVRNYWAAGYANVITGSFFRTRDDYLRFRDLVPEVDEVYMVQLLVERDERQHRRLSRAKQTTQEWRDRVDLVDTGDTTIAADQDGYRYLGVDSTGMTPEQTVAVIRRAIPEIYGPPPSEL
ncbi:zeta toxin family protein [Nonomuraea deserti]|uniref:zeta toxin family protein n=1 Tax=Nonomuraea deserti TaxID=1848322 RepID=UPI001404B6BA|nr:zeta toxin family protein [Nonomuraea deserti]